MKGVIPYGYIYIDGASSSNTKALTTSIATMDLWSTIGTTGDSTGGTAGGGDPAVKPDKTNNRFICNAPGTYKLRVELSGVIDSAADVTITARKSATAIAGGVSKQRWATTKTHHTMECVFVLSASDAPGTLSTFADPAAGGFAGGGAAPKTGVAIDIGLTCSGSQTITIENARFYVERIG